MFGDRERIGMPARVDRRPRMNNMPLLVTSSKTHSTLSTVMQAEAARVESELQQRKAQLRAKARSDQVRKRILRNTSRKNLYPSNTTRVPLRLRSPQVTLHPTPSMRDEMFHLEQSTPSMDNNGRQIVPPINTAALQQSSRTPQESANSDDETDMSLRHMMDDENMHITAHVDSADNKSDRISREVEDSGEESNEIDGEVSSWQFLTSTPTTEVNFESEPIDPEEAKRARMAELVDYAKLQSEQTRALLQADSYYGRSLQFKRFQHAQRNVKPNPRQSWGSAAIARPSPAGQFRDPLPMSTPVQNMGRYISEERSRYLRNVQNREPKTSVTLQRQSGLFLRDNMRRYDVQGVLPVGLDNDVETALRGLEIAAQEESAMQWNWAEGDNVPLSNSPTQLRASQSYMHLNLSPNDGKKQPKHGSLSNSRGNSGHGMRQSKSQPALMSTTTGKRATITRTKSPAAATRSEAINALARMSIHVPGTAHVLGRRPKTSELPSAGWRPSLDAFDVPLSVGVNEALAHSRQSSREPHSNMHRMKTPLFDKKKQRLQTPIQWLSNKPSATQNIRFDDDFYTPTIHSKVARWK